MCPSVGKCFTVFSAFRRAVLSVPKPYSRPPHSGQPRYAFEAPLPPNWDEHLDADGRVRAPDAYFFEDFAELISAS